LGKLIRTISKDRNIHAYFADLKDVAMVFQQNHKTNIISTTILSRAFTSIVLLSGNLKNNSDILSMEWKCTGPVKNIFVEARGDGTVRGYIEEASLNLIDGALVDGNLLAEKYIGLGEIVTKRYSQNGKPYSSITLIETGEIAEDVSIYLNQSLQIDSTINIGVSINGKNGIESCGGLLVMAMPNTSKDDIDKIYNTFLNIKSMTNVLKNDKIDKLVSKYSKELNLEILDTKKISFNCNCNYDKIENLIKSFSNEDINSLLNEEDKIEVACQFCGKIYTLNY